MLGSLWVSPGDPAQYGLSARSKGKGTRALADPCSRVLREAGRSDPVANGHWEQAGEVNRCWPTSSCAGQLGSDGNCQLRGASTGEILKGLSAQGLELWQSELWC